MNYNRFDPERHEVPADPCAGKVAIVCLIVWGIIASLAILETFTDLLD